MYPSRLASYVSDALGRPAGRISGELLLAVRSELRLALGLGTGVCTDHEVPQGSRRGCIVTFNREHVRMTGFSHALVVTEPSYSRFRRQQTVIPILPETAFVRGTCDVTLRGKAWIREIDPDEESVIVATPFVATVFDPDAIAWYTDSVLDSATMDAVDQALTLYFGL